jgi:hypothetical protein
MTNILTRIVTPAFIAFNAHCWFAYAMVYTFPHTALAFVLGAGVKEFYIDKHYESAQDFDDNLQDFGGYCAGIVLALCAKHYV